MGGGKLGVNRNGLLVFGPLFFPVSPPSIDDAEVEVGIRILRVKSQHFLVLGNGLLQVSPLGSLVSELEMFLNAEGLVFLSRG